MARFDDEDAWRRRGARRRALSLGVAAAAVMSPAALAGCSAQPPLPPALDAPTSAVDAPVEPAEPEAPTVAASTATAPARHGERVRFRDTGGRRSEYRVYAPEGLDPSAPMGLILDFHGDGGDEYFAPGSPDALGGDEGIVAQGVSRGYLVVPVLAPKDAEGEHIWWGNDGVRNARYVHDLLEQLERQYPIRADDIWLVGYSGGAEFITQDFLPMFATDILGGGAVLFGGGGVPVVPPKSFDESFIERFPMHWLSGQDDLGTPFDPYSGLTEAEEGEEWFAKAGFATSSEHPEGVDHDLAGWFGPVLGQQLDEHPYGQ